MFFADVQPVHVAMFIPFVVIAGAVAISVTAIIISGRKKELEHRERLIAMERGIDIPLPPEPERKPVHSGRRAGGLVLTLLGLALTFALTISEGADAGVWGLMPTALGVGLLIASVMDKREYEERRREKGQPPTDA